MPIIEYQEKQITYQLQKKKIKNLYIQIREGEVIVKAPNRMKDSTIQQIVQKKSKWIYESIKQEKEKIKAEKAIGLKERERLEKIIQEAIQKYTYKLKVEPNKIRIRELHYAWGSCSSKKNISFNINLANKSEKAIEYVVIHELCHLKEMNHSKKFWDLVESCMKDYKIYRKELK